MTSDDPETLVDRAQQLLTDNDTSEAISLLDETLAKFPDFADAYDARALGYMQLGRYLDALEDLKKFGKLSGDGDPMVFAHFGEVLRNMGRYDDALEAATKSLEIDEQFPDARYLRGWLFFYCGQYREAEYDFAFCVENTDDAGESTDLLTLCRKINCENLSEIEIERELRRSGFSTNAKYNENYAAEEMSCPYAHCIRTQPSRSDEAEDCCELTGFACPGGAAQVAHCSEIIP